MPPLRHSSRILVSVTVSVAQHVVAQPACSCTVPLEGLSWLGLAARTDAMPYRATHAMQCNAPCHACDAMFHAMLHAAMLGACDSLRVLLHDHMWTSLSILYAIAPCSSAVYCSQICSLFFGWALLSARVQAWRISKRLVFLLRPTRERRTLGCPRVPISCPSANRTWCGSAAAPPHAHGSATSVETRTATRGVASCAASRTALVTRRRANRSNSSLACL